MLPFRRKHRCQNLNWVFLVPFFVSLCLFLVDIMFMIITQRDGIGKRFCKKLGLVEPVAVIEHMHCGVGLWRGTMPYNVVKNTKTG